LPKIQKISKVESTLTNLPAAKVESIYTNEPRKGSQKVLVSEISSVSSNEKQTGANNNTCIVCSKLVKHP